MPRGTHKGMGCAERCSAYPMRRAARSPGGEGYLAGVQVWLRALGSAPRAGYLALTVTLAAFLRSR